MGKRKPRVRYKSETGLCTFEGCGRPHKAKGFCTQHYTHARTGIPPKKIGPCRYRGERKFDVCQVAGCGRIPTGKGFCMTHYYVLYKRGVDPHEFQRVLDRQGGGCAICGGAEQRDGARLAVDHCHKTGVFRGALCMNCNQGLGKFGDDPDTLEKAAAYLRAASIIRKVA